MNNLWVVGRFFFTFVLGNLIFAPWEVREVQIYTMNWAFKFLHAEYNCLFFPPSKYEKKYCFRPNNCFYIIWVANSLDLRWGPTFYAVSFGYKLYAKVIICLQNSQQVDKVLTFWVLITCIWYFSTGYYTMRIIGYCTMNIISAVKDGRTCW